MKERGISLYLIISITLFLLFSKYSFAACTKTSSIMNISESTSTPLNFGKIHYSSNAIQPVGSILSQLTIPPTHKALSPETILWTCDKADLPNIYFLVATAGWNSFGGREDLGAGVYATWFRYVGLKQTMAGVTLGKYWKRINISTYKLENNKIKIRLRDIPPLKATLIKTDKLPESRKATENCHEKMAIAGTYSQASLFGGGTDKCKTASAFVQLSGNSKVDIPFGHDSLGSDSATNNKFFRANNGLIYGLGNSNTTLTQNYTCVVRTQKPLIRIPPISAVSLQNNAFSEAAFNLDLECNSNLQSGINPSQIAMGFLPSNSSHIQSRNLNLLNKNGTSRFLISENYNQSNNAKGIGIAIKNSKTNRFLNFLNLNAPTGGGDLAGWYPITEENTIMLNASNTGVNLYRKEYRAVLKKLPDHTPTPGLFTTTATIKVKIQ